MAINSKKKCCNFIFNFEIIKKIKEYFILDKSYSEINGKSMLVESCRSRNIQPERKSILVECSRTRSSYTRYRR